MVVFFWYTCFSVCYFVFISFFLSLHIVQIHCAYISGLFHQLSWCSSTRSFSLSICILYGCLYFYIQWCFDVCYSYFLFSLLQFIFKHFVYLSRFVCRYYDFETLFFFHFFVYIYFKLYLFAFSIPLGHGILHL